MGDELIGDGRIIIMNVPLMIAWIRINREFSDAEVEKMNQRLPDLTKALMNVEFEELIEIFERHKEHPIYGDSIGIALSPQGRKWMKRTLEQVQKVGMK